MPDSTLATMPTTDNAETNTSINNLDTNTMRHVLSFLRDPKDLVSIDQCNSHFQAAGKDPLLWKNLSERRWGPTALNESHFSTQHNGAVDYKLLFATNNNWSTPKFQTTIIQREALVQEHSVVAATVSLSNNVAALAYIHVEWGAHPQFGVQIMKLQESEDDFPSTMLSGDIGSLDNLGLISSRFTTAIEFIDVAQGLVAIGCSNGEIGIIKAYEGHSMHDEDSFQPFRQWIVREDLDPMPIPMVKFHQESNSLVALRDSTRTSDMIQSNSRGFVEVLDATTGVSTAHLEEILSYYDVCGMAVLPNTHEVVVASVKQSQGRETRGWCSKCLPGTLYSLCSHKNRSASACLTSFDLRTGLTTSRIACPHRTIYPRIELARDHYLLVSHAGNPFSVWDRRYIDRGPLYEEPPIDFSSCAFVSAPAPLDIYRQRNAGPYLYSGALRHQALNLHANCEHGLLVGRNDIGDSFVWDLSAVLGWQDTWSSSDASPGMGSLLDQAVNLQDSAINRTDTAKRSSRPLVCISGLPSSLRMERPSESYEVISQSQVWIHRQGLLAVVSHDPLPTRALQCSLVHAELLPRLNESNENK